MGDEQRLPFDGVLEEVVRDAVSATRVEARASVLAARDAVALRDGRPAGTSGADRLWSFEVDRDLAPMPETPGTLVVDGRDGTLPVRVLAVGDSNLVLAVREELGTEVAAATLSLTAGFVYEALQRRLEHLVLDGDADASLVDALFHPDPDDEADGLVPIDEPGPDGEQRAAATNAVIDGLRFTWGPPGTGKTRVLAMAVAEAVQRGDRVLVVAHANAAVDVAMARIAETIGEADGLLDDGAILRAGPPHLPVLADHPRVLTDHHLAERYPDEVRRRAELHDERRAYSDRARQVDDDHRRLTADLQDLRGEIIGLDRRLAAAAGGLIADARVVGTTLAKLVVDDDLWAWPADVVIVDEASMVGLPFALALAARRPRTLSFFGDFRQLPPIAVAESHEAHQWYGRDVFEAAGVTDAYERGETDRRVQMLRTQFRMGEQICATINDFAYGGLLATASSARDRAIAFAERWPSPGVEVVLVDTSSLGGDCLTDIRPDSYSRFAISSAALAVTIAEATAAELAVEVGAVSPYRAQVELVAATVGDHPRITAATIHRFQGSERDVIVFDLTDGPDQRRPSLLTGGDPDLSLRLMNVAASRARAKLIVLADLGWAETSPIGSNNRRLLAAAEEAGCEIVDAVDLLTTMPAFPEASPLEPTVTWCSTWDEAVAPFFDVGDPHRSMLPIDLHVPSADVAGDRLSNLAATPDRRATVRGPFSVVRPLDGTPVDVRLAPVGAAPWLVVGDDALIVGGRSPGDPAARMTGRRVVAAYRRLTGTTR